MPIRPGKGSGHLNPVSPYVFSKYFSFTISILLGVIYIPNTPIIINIIRIR